MSIHPNLIALAVVLGCTTTTVAYAQPDKPMLCYQAQENLERDPWLREAMRLAYPDITSGEAKPRGACLFPYAAVLYPGAVLLLTLSGVPGEACHGCAASVSATLFRRMRGGDLKVLARHPEFAKVGTWGAVAGVHGGTFGKDPAILLEGVGVFQGEHVRQLHTFLFRNGRAQDLTPKEHMILRYDDCAARGAPCVSIEGTWRADPGGRVVIHYQGSGKDKKAVDETVIYEQRVGERLSLVSGRVPGPIPEWLRAKPVQQQGLSPQEQQRRRQMQQMVPGGLSPKEWDDLEARADGYLKGMEDDLPKNKRSR